MKLLSFLARRFVAGETMADAVNAVRQVNSQNMSAIVDFLGEHVNTVEEAQLAVDEYLRLLQVLKESDVKASISLKASQMGLLVSPDLCLQNLRTVVKQAEAFGTMVWIDMEGSDLTQKTIDVFDRLQTSFSNIGLCLQAYLIRTGGDIDRLMRHPFKVRLCKGAYKESETVAYATTAAVEGSFRMLTQKLLEAIPRGVYPAFATHDRALIQEILGMVRQHKTPFTNFEFQMLYGIENNHLKELVSQGCRGHVYIPYGKQWLPYFMRRLRERKENVYFLMRNLFRR